MKIRRHALDSVLFHGHLSRPRECCGILMTQNDESSPVDLVFWGENAEKKQPESRYVLDHRSHLKAVEMECSGSVRIVGYYHSHSAADSTPSCIDRDHGADGVSYVIVYVGEDGVECSAWRFENGEFVREPLEVIE